jgi:hypothetical protein
LLQNNRREKALKTIFHFKPLGYSNISQALLLNKIKLTSLLKKCAASQYIKLCNVTRTQMPPKNITNDELART